MPIDRFVMTVFREGDQWVAHCLLPVDYAVQAPTAGQAVSECVDGVTHDIDFFLHRNPLEYLQPASPTEIADAIDAAYRACAAIPTEDKPDAATHPD